MRENEEKNAPSNGRTKIKFQCFSSSLFRHFFFFARCFGSRLQIQPFLLCVRLRFLASSARRPLVSRPFPATSYMRRTYAFRSVDTARTAAAFFIYFLVPLCVLPVVALCPDEECVRVTLFRSSSLGGRRFDGRPMSGEAPADNFNWQKSTLCQWIQFNAHSPPPPTAKTEKNV